MNLRALVSVTGKPGLFKLIGQNKGGFILESLDEKKIKSTVNLSTTKMATLEDITIYGEEDEIRLLDVFQAVKEAGKETPDAKADGNTLREFFREVAPGHDESRVYSSDIKKIISWYNIIKDLPLFEEEAPAPIQQA
ncbi:DUF5606 family protein [Sphingobacterium paludis]|uniref:Uncharacterized protein n=1 Tax=Sphingobacterium paludis TaxID=1476465 RepID=A0A4R7CWJ4_9SPHI|nr:DUF5606 domain-containing protein [Sphingobacterium paludis]TDS12237.1 hypothetical protein B0I21_10692 [Sphingobacterium paludis]